MRVVVHAVGVVCGSTVLALAGCGGGAVDPASAQPSARAAAVTRPDTRGSWQTIALEGQAFTIGVRQVVRFGAPPGWVNKVVDGNGQCTVAFFGSDPAPGAHKVCQAQPGYKATLSWTPPATNDDGSPATDIAGYRIDYGTNATQLSQTVQVPGATTTTTSIDGLGAGTYYFSAVTLNNAGEASEPTGLVSVTFP